MRRRVTIRETSSIRSLTSVLTVYAFTDFHCDQRRPEVEFAVGWLRLAEAVFDIRQVKYGFLLTFYRLQLVISHRLRVITDFQCDNDRPEVEIAVEIVRLWFSKKDV